MKGLRYLDFDLMIKRTAYSYRVQVDSPAGQAVNEFALPFSDLEIENYLLRFGRPRQPMRRLENTQIEAARAFGGRLFAAVFNGEVRSCLRSSIDDAERQDAGLRIRLRLADAPELNDLPWEFLLHPELGRFLALSAETPIVRYLDLPERIRPLTVTPPLKVLTVISSPIDYTPLDVEAEWRKLQESLAELQERGLLILSRLESPTLTHLQRWLRRESCHILHFIGHGGFNSKTEDGLLLFSDEKGRGREVTGQTLGTLLHDHRPLRLAVLNACEGARTSRTDPFSGVAQSLVQHGIPAVVAMQFEISDKAAITFADGFYAAVVDGYPVDAALAEARKSLVFAGHELEWGAPVLYMRSPDGRIFDIEPVAAPANIVKTREEPTAAQAEPIESRPALSEIKPAPAEPKTPLPEAAAKATPGELVPAATIGIGKEEPTTAKPEPIEARPVPAAVKPAPAEPRMPAKAPPDESAPAATNGTGKEEPNTARPGPSDSRPALVEARPAPAEPKALSPEAAAKTTPGEFVPAATIGTGEEEPTAAKPEPIESLPAPAPAVLKMPAKGPPDESAPAAANGAIKEELTAAKPEPIEARPAPSEAKPGPFASNAPPSEAAATAPVVLKVLSVESPPPAVPKALPSLNQIPEHVPTEAKTGKAMPLAASQERDLPRRVALILAGIGLLALLAMFITIRLFSESEESEAQAPLRVRQGTGVYLVGQVRAGDKPIKEMFVVGEGEPRHSKELPTLDDALSHDLCFTTNFDRGHKLIWDDLSRCK